MRTFCGLWVVAGLLVCGPLLAAQTNEKSSDPADSRMDRLERRLDEMDRKHQEELKARDKEIARLKAQLERRGAPSSTTKATGARDGTEDLLKEIDAATPG